MVFSCCTSACACMCVCPWIKSNLSSKWYPGVNGMHYCADQLTGLWCFVWRCILAVCLHKCLTIPLYRTPHSTISTALVQSEISGSMDTCYCKQSLTTSKRYEWLTAISNTIAFPCQWYIQSNNAPWTLLLEIVAWAMLPLSLLLSSLHAPSVLLLANAFFPLGVSRAAMSDCMLLCCWWQSSNTQIWHGFVSEDVYGATSALNYHNYYNYHVTFS